VVVLSRKFSAVLLLLASFILFVGCSKNPTEQVIDQAVMQLEVYSKSRSVVFAGTPDSDVPDSRTAQQKIRQVSSEQQQAFKRAMEDLRTVAEAPVEDNLQARDGARVKSLLAAMQLYVANWAVDDVTLFDSRFFALGEKINTTCIEMERLKQEQAKMQPVNYDAAIAHSKQVIDELTKAKSLNESQLKKLTEVIANLKTRLAGAIKQRDDLGTKIGEIADKVNTVPGSEGVRLQKMVGELERERFKVLLEIERLTAGPMELPPELQAEVGTQKLKEIGGLKQLEQEKLLLESRVKSATESLASQETYLKNLTQQVSIAVQKGSQLAKRLDELTAVLKGQLKGMDELMARRNDLSTKAMSATQTAMRTAQAASSDLKRFVGAVSQAKSKVPSGVDDDTIKGAEAMDSLEFSVAQVAVNAQLGRARILSATLRLIDTVVPVIKRGQQLTALPEALAKFVAEAPATQATIEKDLPEVLNKALTQYDSVNKKAARGNLQTVVGTSLALAFSQAAELLPAKKGEYETKANEVLDKIMTAPAGGATESQDPLMQPAKELKRELGK